MGVKWKRKEREKERERQRERERETDRETERQIEVSLSLLYYDVILPRSIFMIENALKR